MSQGRLTTDPGDLVLDPTCGSGTTAFVAEKWGRRWITADTSRVAVTLAKQRLMTASYDYYALKYPHEGLRSGFIYKTVPHVTLGSIANNPEIDEIYARMHPAVETALAALNAILPDSASFPRRRESKVFVASLDSRLRGNDDSAGQSGNDGGLKEWQVPFDFPVDWPEAAKEPFDAFHAARQAMQKQMDASIAAHAGQEILYDQPAVSKSKLRITGPFTVEAVPFATVLGLDEAEQPKEADIAVARSGATWRQSQWRDELLKAGIRGKGGQKIQLLDLVPLPGAKYIHAIGTVADTGDKVAVSFGPEHAALEQRQVEIAMREAGELFPLPKMLVFCAFTFDPEAAKDIDTIKGITALRVQMNTDLLTEDLKKGRASNESFWLMGQPDVIVKQIKAGCYQVEVHGFDYFDTKTGELKSGGKKNIAMWALDTDYDNRSLFPRQVFFPMAGSGDGWNKLRKDIRAELNEELLEQFHGTVSLPFEAGENECIAVKIVDDRGIESLKVINLDRISV
ncbi:DNA methyltransferase [Nitrosomonas sp.]|uniref:DNA methyltransferase n=1 Tax=Nitrosomonas sp. TaxID=42353 RepID=UPI0035234845